MTNPVLRALVDLRDRQIQKARIQFSNRVSAIERMADGGSDTQAGIVQRWLDVFVLLETDLDRDIAEMVRLEPMYEQLADLKGIGPMLAAKLLAMVPIENTPSVSALWRFAGYGVKDGERERPVKGEKLTYNVRLKTTLYLIGSSFLKCNSPYRRIYDSAREYYLANRPDWTKGHQHAAAMRKMIKIFLQHFWVRARQEAGLSLSMPYVHERMGHDTYFTPEEFGWEAVGNLETEFRVRAELTV